jgi:hypothetical protein
VVIGTLTTARHGATSTKRDWIVEAAEQILSLNATGPG